MTHAVLEREQQPQTTLNHHSSARHEARHAAPTPESDVAPTPARERTLWEKLSDTSTEAGHTFMESYNKLNDSLGHALGQLKEQPQDIQGRDKEIQLLHAILERPKTPVALLLGQAGVGKTALVEQFGKELNSGHYKTHTHYTYMLMTLRLGTLASLGTHELQSRLSTLFDDIYKLEEVARHCLHDDSIRLVLFMDEVHMLVTIFGPGTKVGGDVMKDVLARAPIRVIAATTRREYDATIAVDKPLSERFKQIEISELDPNIVIDVVKDWWSKVAPDCPMVEERLIRKVIEANAMYRSDSAEPRKSLDIMEDLVSHCRRTGTPATEEIINDIFKRRYSVSLSFSVNADDVYANVQRRVKGQPFAMFTLKRLLRSMVFQLDPVSNKPMATALFTGPTGVGKTETTKAIAEALYPGEKVLAFFNMPDYKTPEHEPAFRKRLGESVRHTPNSIILLDELEKAHETILDSLLTILDEGLVTFETINREGSPEVNQTSLRNTIVICTTNAGSSIFANDARYSQREAKGQDVYDSTNAAEVDQLMKELRPNLEAHAFKPELLGRFDRIVPYRSLTSDTMLKIAEHAMNDLFDKFENRHGISIVTNPKRQWPKDTYNHVTTDLALYLAYVKTSATKSNAGGARAIRREIDTLIKDAIIDAVVDHPESKTFKIEVSKDAKIYDPGAATTKGGVIVHALD